MPPLVLVASMAAKSLNKKQRQMVFGTGEVVRVQWAQQRVSLNAGIEHIYESIKRRVAADLSVNFSGQVLHN